MDPTPYETSIQEVAAVLQARTLLLRLSDHRLTPRVPREIRAEARALLRWFPPAGRLRPVLEGPACLQRQAKHLPEIETFRNNQIPGSETPPNRTLSSQ
jgi:hypothetical protein